jgi:predicted FMN-binding regulatory protein PaiB
MAEEEAEVVGRPLGLLAVQVVEEQVAMPTPVRFMERQEPQIQVVAEGAEVTSTEMAEQVAPVLLLFRTPEFFPAQVLFTFQMDQII